MTIKVKPLRDRIAEICETTGLMPQDKADRILSAIEAVDPATIRAEALREAAMAGWNACRTSIYAVCEDVTNEAERLNVEGDYSAGHVAGTKRAAKSIARGFNSMEAGDDDNFCAAILALIDKEQDQ